MFCQVTSKSPARRIPRQQRSRKRYRAIVDAAASLFADVGFEKATVEGIAELADTSVGSVYQFFGGKKDLFLAVIEQNMAMSKQLFDVLHNTSNLPESWQDMLVGAVDGFANLYASNIGFRALTNNLHLTELYVEMENEIREQYITRSAQIITHYAPHLSQDRAQALSKAINIAISGALLLASQLEPQTTQPDMTETKTMLLRYLEPEITPTKDN